MNGTFIFVLLIITIVMISQVAKAYIKQRNKQPEVNRELEETLAKIDVLEERIQVLERIITESKYDLKKEIDNL
jgi:Na+-transporting methylmalonyl-CoA/oxaloacetate decarboxylase gamma subunit